MKNLFLLLIAAVALVCFTANTSQAQIVKSQTLSKSSLVSTDTAYVAISVDGSYKSITAKVLKDTGTVAGRYVLSGTIDGTNYQGIDSTTYTNVAYAQFKVFNFGTSGQVYKTYKITFFNTGGKVAATCYTLRRSN